MLDRTVSSLELSGTLGLPEAPQPDGPSGCTRAVLIMDQNLRNSSPGGYLSNQIRNLPDQTYSTSAFSVKYVNSQLQQPARDVFVVAPKIDPAGAKNAFLAWLHTLCMTDSQIARVDIVYSAPQIQGNPSARDRAVAAFKDSLPYFQGPDFAIVYERATDTTSVVIFDDHALGEKNFDAYLRKYGVQDRSWINNLVIKYT